jgi:phosphohistidine phosphatase
VAAVELYLVRHAIAEERGPKWPDDDLRPLTANGVARFRDVVRGLRALEIQPDVVLTSPLTRARQTATLLIDGLDRRPTLKVLPALVPGQSPEATLAAALRASNRERLALVGHEPGLGQLAAWLIGTPQPLAFKKGGIARIDLSGRVGKADAKGQLVWFLPPKVLRAIG